MENCIALKDYETCGICGVNAETGALFVLNGKVCYNCASIPGCMECTPPVSGGNA